MRYPIVEPSKVRHQNLKNEIVMSPVLGYPPVASIDAYPVFPIDMNGHTTAGGIAQAQSRAKLPCKGAFETSSGEASVVPIHSM